MKKTPEDITQELADAEFDLAAAKAKRSVAYNAYSAGIWATKTTKTGLAKNLADAEAVVTALTKTVEELTSPHTSKKAAAAAAADTQDEAEDEAEKGVSAAAAAADAASKVLQAATLALPSVDAPKVGVCPVKKYVPPVHISTEKSLWPFFQLFEKNARDTDSVVYTEFQLASHLMDSRLLASGRSDDVASFDELAFHKTTGFLRHWKQWKRTSSAVFGFKVAARRFFTLRNLATKNKKEMTAREHMCVTLVTEIKLVDSKFSTDDVTTNPTPIVSAAGGAIPAVTFVPASVPVVSLSKNGGLLRDAILAVMGKRYLDSVTAGDADPVFDDIVGSNTNDALPPYLATILNALTIVSAAFDIDTAIALLRKKKQERMVVTL